MVTPAHPNLNDRQYWFTVGLLLVQVRRDGFDKMHVSCTTATPSKREHVGIEGNDM